MNRAMTRERAVNWGECRRWLRNCRCHPGIVWSRHRCIAAESWAVFGRRRSYRERTGSAQRKDLQLRLDSLCTVSSVRVLICPAIEGLSMIVVEHISDAGSTPAISTIRPAVWSRTRWNRQVPTGSPEAEYFKEQ